MTIRFSLRCAVKRDAQRGHFQFKAAEDSRTPRRWRVISHAIQSARSWSAAVLCRFTLGSLFCWLRFNVLTLLTLLMCILRPATLCAQQPASEEGPSRFCAVDIFIDSKNAPLAAYQLEFSPTNGVAKIIGIEGGDSAAFHEPPFYDAKAIQHERVIIAAFSTSSADKLPSGKTRIATIHLQIVGGASPQYQLNLQVAANPDGNRISVNATFEERKSE